MEWWEGVLWHTPLPVYVVHQQIHIKGKKERHWDTHKPYARITSSVCDMCVYKHMYGYRVLHTQKHPFRQQQTAARLIRICLTCEGNSIPDRVYLSGHLVNCWPVIWSHLPVYHNSNALGEWLWEEHPGASWTAHKAIDPSPALCASTGAVAQMQIYASSYVTQRLQMQLIISDD